jgi:hypothetical protein
MQESDWVLTAAIASFSYEPMQTFAEAIAVARELYQVWPNIDPREAVQCFYAPDGNVAESIVCELAG